MNWYYLTGGERKGPFDAPAFRELYVNGIIGLKQMVSNEASGSAIQLDQAIQSGVADELNLQNAVACPTCGSSVTTDVLIPMDNIKVCPNCRDEYIQRSREGVSLENTSLELAGIGRRIVGGIIDGILMGVVGAITGGLIAVIQEPSAAIALNIIGSYVIPALYYILMMAGKSQGTIGMLAMGIKIVRPDGAKISYKQSIGRYFASWISGLILMVGYLMAVWDEEKRTLHDRWANTRVIMR